ncbi:MAG: hypothetical protein H7A23_03640 [Leptospiraceae bacterium]|nr:hypothetical protein [Leptospiraceae bacterium]MCP5493623.1 hypothetical protein [Leptospiraceae bacterium]
MAIARRSTGTPTGAVSSNNENVIVRLVAAVPEPFRKYAKVSIPIIMKECKKYGVLDKGQIAYILATVHKESNFGRWMKEVKWSKNDGLDEKTYFMNKYGSRKDLGNIRPEDGYDYRGRGFCQITGRYNYERWSKKLGIDLLNSPDKAADTEIAAKILVEGMRDGGFTKHKLSDHIQGTKKDFINARRIINRLDAADEIAGFANTYYSILVS